MIKYLNPATPQGKVFWIIVAAIAIVVVAKTLGL